MKQINYQLNKPFSKIYGARITLLASKLESDIYINDLPISEAYKLEENHNLCIKANGIDEDISINMITKILDSDIEELEEIKIAFYSAKEYDHIYFDKLKEDYHVVIDYFEQNLNKDTVTSLKEYDCVCVFVSDILDEYVLKHIDVSCILLRCSGYNNVDLDIVKKLNMHIYTVPSYSPEAIAEQTIALLQVANHRYHKTYMKVKENNFALNMYPGKNLHHLTIGIVGVGSIGKALARICQGYGMKVLGYDLNPSEDSIQYASFNQLLSSSDIISLHLPLTKDTYHLINRETINQMKDGVMLVNTSRGALIDIEALIEACKQGKFHAVSLDVYEGEDANVYFDKSDEILDTDIIARLSMFPNVFISSHQAFFTTTSLKHIAIITLENTIQYRLERI